MHNANLLDRLSYDVVTKGKSWFHAAKMVMPPLKPTVAHVAMKALVSSRSKKSIVSRANNQEMAVKGDSGGQHEVDLDAVDPIDPEWISPDGGMCPSFWKHPWMGCPEQHLVNVC